MNAENIMKVFSDTAYIRVGGRPEEKKAAEYLRRQVVEFGLEAALEPFDVPLGDIEEAMLLVDGVSIPCKGYMCAGSSTVEAPFYYLRTNDAWSLRQCKGKIVLIDGYLGYWIYQDLLENGAVGFVTYDGHVNYADRDIDARELRSYVSNGKIIPGVNINVKDAVSLIEKGVKSAKIVLKQKEYMGTSQNVVLDMPGEVDEYIVFTAHYDSTPLSQGAYDNMSGSIGLLGIAEHFAKNPHRYGLRFVWCGCEERGLLGSKAYCAAHEEELSKIALNINLDMIGCIMGKFIACVSAEEKLSHYITYMAAEVGFPVESKTGVYSSDSTPFADQGVPALSFARDASRNVAPIHCRYDLKEVLSMEQLQKDINFLTTFTKRFANAATCPVSRTIPEKIRKELDEYLYRKRKEA